MYNSSVDMSYDLTGNKNVIFPTLIPGIEAPWWQQSSNGQWKMEEAKERFWNKDGRRASELPSAVRRCQSMQCQMRICVTIVRVHYYVPLLYNFYTCMTSVCIAEYIKLCSCNGTVVWGTKPGLVHPSDSWIPPPPPPPPRPTLVWAIRWGQEVGSGEPYRPGWSAYRRWWLLYPHFTTWCSVFIHYIVFARVSMDLWCLMHFIYI